MTTPQQMDDIRIHTRAVCHWLYKLAGAYDNIGLRNVGDVYREWAQMVLLTSFHSEQVYQREQEEQKAS